MMDSMIFHKGFYKSLLFVLCLFLCGCDSHSSTYKAQERAINGYMQGLFGGDLEQFMKYSSYGYAFASMQQSNLANLFVAAETTRAKMNGGYQHVKILSIEDITHKDDLDDMPTVNAEVSVVFGSAILETSLKLVNYEDDKWIVASLITLNDNMPHKD